MSLFEKCKTDSGYFGQQRLEDDRYFVRPIFDGPPGAHVTFEGKDVICWSINDYLGMCQNEEVNQVALDAVREVGISSPMGSRMLTGNTREHLELEEALAKLVKKEKSLVFNYGYMGVLGTISALIGPEDHIVMDKHSHACIVDAAFLASKRKRFHVFRHNDTEHLEEILKSIKEKSDGGILVLTEGVFGMEGDVAPLKEICRIKDKYGAKLFVDDAHGFGVMGKNGTGCGEHLGCQDGIDLYFGTFAKSFAAIGGFVAGDKSVIDYIEFNARTHIFAKALPLIYVRAVRKTLDIIFPGTERRNKMWQIAQALQNGLKENGFELGKTDSPVTPVYVPMGNEEMGKNIVRFLRDEGIFVSAVVYPVVPMGIMLFRMIPTTNHSLEDVKKTIEAFKKVRTHFTN